MSYLADLERKYIAALDRVKALEQELAEKTDALDTLSFVPDVPAGLRLTKREDLVLRSLLKRPLATKEQVMSDAYADLYDLGDEPEIKIVDVFVCKIRKKMKPFGLTIETQLGAGYRVPPETRQAIRRMNEEALGEMVRRAGGART